MKPKLRNQLLALGALTLAGGALLFVTQSSLGENLVYYWTPSEMLAQGSKAVGPTIRLGGVVEGGSILWDEAQRILHFRVCDSETHSPKTCTPVRSMEVPPQMFREHIGVVIEGKLQPDATFSSKRLMVNHSNEYQAPKDGLLPPNWKESFSEDNPPAPMPPHPLPQGAFASPMEDLPPNPTPPGPGGAAEDSPLPGAIAPPPGVDGPVEPLPSTPTPL